MRIIAYMLVVILFIITFPIGCVIFLVASNETFEGDPVPKYYIRWNDFLLFPLKLIKK